MFPLLKSLGWEPNKRPREPPSPRGKMPLYSKKFIVSQQAIERDKGEKTRGIEGRGGGAVEWSGIKFLLEEKWGKEREKLVKDDLKFSNWVTKTLKLDAGRKG